MKDVSLEFLSCKEDLDNSQRLLGIVRLAGIWSERHLLESVAHRLEPHGVIVIVVFSNLCITLHAYAKKNLCRVNFVKYDRTKLQLETIAKYLQEELKAKSYKVLEKAL